MSVVTGGKTVFCEGKQSSLDYQLLNKLVGDQCTIIPSGGKFSYTTFVQGYYFPEEARDKQYIIFRDRDFDINPTDNCSLLKLSNSRKKVLAYLTYRACVENYFIDPELIHTYWTTKYEEKQDNPISRWPHQNSPGIELITKWIEDSARNLRFYQAVRWALGNLLMMSTARVQLKTTWTGGSGDLPISLELQDCTDKALELVAYFRQAIDSVTPENLENSLFQYLQRFNQEEFWIQRQYQVWFHGKDLIKKMHQQKPDYMSLNDNFLMWAVNQLDINQHRDLVELKAKIEQL